MNSESAHSQEILAYVLGELSAEERRDFEQQMAADPVLVDEVHELESVYHSMAYTRPLMQPPEDAFNRVLEQLEPRGGFPWRESFWALGGIAAGVLITFGLSLGGMNSKRTHPLIADENSTESGVFGSQTASEISTSEPSESVNNRPPAAEFVRMENSIAVLMEENAKLRLAIIRITDELERAQGDVTALAAWRDRYFDPGTGISRWSVLTLGKASNVSTSSTLTDYLEQLSMTDPAVVVTDGFTTADEGITSNVEGASTPIVGGDNQSDSVSSPTNAMVLWDETGDEGILAVTSLPPIQQGTNYQMWLVDETGLAKSAGILPEFPDGTGQAAFALPETSADVGTVLITVEPAGGSESPTGATILEGPIATVDE